MIIAKGNGRAVAGLASRRSGIAALGIARMVLLIGASTLFLACGADAEPGNGGDGGSGGTGGAGGAVEPAPDPLNLRGCAGPIGVLADSVDLPDLSWSDGGDDHAAYCAFRALDALLEDRKIICLGENDHGDSETSRWNSALVRYLVHRWGVRVIAYEGDRASAEHWNRYLSSGDAADLE